MAYQINLTGQEIDERLQNVGTPADNPDANGTLFARLNKNVDDVDELRDTVGHIDSAQNATDKTVAQHTADISTLQTALKKKANLVLGKVSVNELPVATSLGNPNNGTIPSTFAVSKAINDKIVGLLNWQGVKDTTDEIKDIALAKKGDVWHSNEDGSEWVCTEDIFTADHSVWEELGTPIDLSGYYTKNEVDKKVKPLADSINSGTLRDLYISAGAKYNEATGFYELNGLTDITEEQMRVIYKYAGTPQVKASHAYSNIRTNFPSPGYYNGSLYDVMFYASKIEVVNLGYRQANQPKLLEPFVMLEGINAFYMCKNLRIIYGRIEQSYVTKDWNLTFGECAKLEEVRISKLKTSIKLSWSPNLSKESVQYMIENANPPSGAAAGSIAITLHPTAYTRLKDDADIVAALEAKNGVITLVSA